MARKFWERLGGQRIQFYKDPLEINRDEGLERIADLQAILNLDDDQKALIAGQLPQGGGDPFEALQDELNELADQVDYWDYEQITESLTVVERGWFSPADGQLGPGTIVSVSSELAGAEAIGAIDKTGSTRWESLPEGGSPDNPLPHDLRFTWGYPKRTQGIRFRVGPTIQGPEILEGVSIWLSQMPGGLNNDNNRFLDNVNLADVAVHNDPWLEIEDFGALVSPNVNMIKGNAVYCRIEISSTGAGNNRAVIRDIEMRCLVRTFGI